jgi:phenylalanyl-tRNA synthetase beta chain
MQPSWCRAIELATKLVMEMCGGTPSENVVVGNRFGEDRVIDFPIHEVKRLAGIDVPFVEMKLILTRLGFMVAGSGPTVKVAVPSWRTDAHGKADIVEEIVRIYGVDKVPETPFERGEESAQTGADADPASHPARPARARGARYG